MIKLNCKTCGKEFLGYLSDVQRRGRKYCSHKCASLARRKNIVCVCGYCNKAYDPHSCRDNLKYCSSECYFAFKREKAKRMFVCKYCGKKIIVKRHKNYYRYKDGKKEIRKYCSKYCADIDKSGINGKDHFNWKGGRTSLQDIIRKSSYSQNYRKECFKRDGWKSALSGSNGRLEHHHLIAFSILIKRHNITKNNWVNFKDILFDLNNAITLTEKEHDKFHGQYGYVTTPEQFEEFRNSGGL